MYLISPTGIVKVMEVVDVEPILCQSTPSDDMRKLIVGALALVFLIEIVISIVSSFFK